MCINCKVQLIPINLLETTLLNLFCFPNCIYNLWGKKGKKREKGKKGKGKGKKREKGKREKGKGKKGKRESMGL